MSLSRFTPFYSVFDDFFEPPITFFPRDLISSGPRTVAAPDTKRDYWRHPGYEVHEDDKNYMVSVDVPGVRSEDINIQVQDKVLCLSGSRKMLNNANGGVSKFDYRLSMGDDVDLEKISANLDCGVLHLIAPKKSAEKPKSRTIQITTNPATASKQIDLEKKVKKAAKDKTNA